MIKKTATFFNKSEGRDKFCKMIQYGSRLGFASVENIDKDFSLRLKKLFENMKDARKLFRLFKFINEIDKIKDFLTNPDMSMDEVEIFLNILQRVGLFGFWFFDNLLILSKVRILKKDPKSFLKPGMFFWWCSLVISLVNSIRKIKLVNKELAFIYKKIKENPDKKKSFQDKINKIKLIKKQKFRAIIKTIGDLITSSYGWGLSPKLGLNYGNKLIGFGGLVSAVITCYELYP